MGWRYFLITVGGLTLIMFLLRFVAFTIYESPKYLMGKAQDEEAVRIVHEVARRNGKTTTFALQDLKACETEGYVAKADAAVAIKRKLQKLNASHVRALFSTKKMAFSTGGIMVIWAFIGLAYPLCKSSCSLFSSIWLWLTIWQTMHSCRTSRLPRALTLGMVQPTSHTVTV